MEVTPSDKVEFRCQADGHMTGTIEVRNLSSTDNLLYKVLREVVKNHQSGAIHRQTELWVDRVRGLGSGHDSGEGE